MSAGALPSIPVRSGNPCRDHGCSACCHDTEMLLTEADLARLRATTGRDDFWFQADDGYLQLRTRDGPAAPGAPSPTAKPCALLAADGTCSVWEDRPEGCRLYPAVWDSELRKSHFDVDCPHTDGFLLPQTTQDAARRLAARLGIERGVRLGRAP